MGKAMGIPKGLECVGTCVRTLIYFCCHFASGPHSKCAAGWKIKQIQMTKTELKDGAGHCRIERTKGGRFGGSTEGACSLAAPVAV